ncbi:MAG: N-6 DNA methylase [Magnetospirillum sp.]|nr:N-6 DNA methylase [Magnetospirillum sp.]
MAEPLSRDPDLEWLDHVQPVGLVVAPSLIKELGLTPTLQTQLDNAVVAETLSDDDEGPALIDPWAFAERVLGWTAPFVAGAPGGPNLPEELVVRLPEYDTTLEPHWAVKAAGQAAGWQMLVRIEPDGVDPDTRGALDGWEATAHQRFERLLRETGVGIGVLISDRTLRLVFAPRGETSGWLAFPLRPLATVAGRAMLGGLKLLLHRFRLLNDAEDRRLPALLSRSREAQAAVSTALSEQVLGALHELLRGLTAAEPELVGTLAESRPAHLYEGLLTVLMRLVFVLYAEDRDLIPSRTDATARAFYDQGYAVRGLHAKLLDDAARNPDTMDERLGAWGRLLALFRLVHAGDRTGWITGRGGKLFDPDTFAFLEGRADPAERPRIPRVSDGSVLRLLDDLVMLKGERLSYRTLDVEQIGSVYETVMGFTVEVATGPVLAIHAGKNNRTPVFVDLQALAAAKPEERLKHLKEEAKRSSLTAKQQAAIKAAKGEGDLAAALEPLVDERGSPGKRVVPAGTPILQPTDERRRTGSHYTPRSLTEPIVRHALEPAFARLGDDATPEQVLDLKVCDPAMGSGAFLVEACRALAARLVKAWAKWPGTRPAIPTDEDEDLHARRLVAQRCLYGVDKNPMAVDLARLSLWLATLARDHEFTFLDHAMKAGDSLVGLTRAQIAALHWDAGKGLPLFGQLVRERFEAALRGRAEIQNAPDDVARAVQEVRYRQVEQRLDHVRLVGNAIIAAFFSAQKPKDRERQRQEIESWAHGPTDQLWPRLEALEATLQTGRHPITPFHWEIEFPEVFARDNHGFDAIVGNPPFAGKNTIIAGSRDGILDWYQTLHAEAHGNADLVAHFFRRAFGLLRQDGMFGLIATNTIAQGDTRQTGLAAILKAGGTIGHALRRLKWPGEAAVVVSVVHVMKGRALQPVLDGRPVRRISAYLVEGNLDGSPAALAANQGKAFQGSVVLGMGFTFDDEAAAKGTASSLAEMRQLIDKDARNAERIFPFIGNQEITNDPRHAHRRYVIDFADMPLCRDHRERGWLQMAPETQSKNLREGSVPQDYPGPVAEDWPDLIHIVRQMVKPQRDKDNREARRKRWWRFGDRQPGLYRAINRLPTVLAVGAAALTHHAFVRVPANQIFSHKLIILAITSLSGLAVLQARSHELWCTMFGSTRGAADDNTYNPSDVLVNFPFPADFETDSGPEDAGRAYHNHRAQLMIARNEGLTKTYNRFHKRDERSPDIVELRRLHDAMDQAVLGAYGWDDLIPLAVPVFLDESNEDDHKYQGRYFWPAEVRDEVLARLLALNAERHEEELRLGIAPGQGGRRQGNGGNDEEQEGGDE